MDSENHFGQITEIYNQMYDSFCQKLNSRALINDLNDLLIISKRVQLETILTILK